MTLSTLTKPEAKTRSDLLEVQRYDIDVDLTGLLEGEVWRSTSTIAFTCSEPGATTFVDVAMDVARAALDVRLKEAGEGLPAEVRGARLWIDAPAPGDLMCPLGMQGRSKKLSDLLGEEHVPVAERPRVPVVRTAPGGAVVWVAGLRLDDRFKCAPTTRILIKLTLRAL